VAQLGSALDWGSRGRRFKSCQPDAGSPRGLGVIHHHGGSQGHRVPPQIAPQILENVHRGYHGQAPDNLTERTAANTHKHAAFIKVRPPKQPRPFLFFSSKALFGDSVPGRGATLFPSRVMPEAAQGAAGRKNRTGVRRGAPNQKRFRNFPFCFCVEAVMLGAAASDLETVCVCCCSFLGRVTGRAVRGDPWQVKKRV
jgi:hypothetical protein